MFDYPFTPEQVCLMVMARMTWGRRGVAKRRRLPFNEESVTETVLQDLAATFPGELQIEVFNKNQEGRNGADWAWGFVSADGRATYSMLVQAKGLDLKDKAYSGLDQKVGKNTDAPLQIDVLLEASTAEGMPALYAFYNHLSDTNRIPDNCQTLSTQVPGFPVESWGISVADALAVSAALPDKSFNTHRRHSVPLHCLLCSRASGERPPGGSPQLALWAVTRLKALGRRRRPLADVEFAADFTTTEPGEIPSILLRPLPPLFRDVQNMRRIEEEAPRQEALDAVGADHPNLAGVVILTDAAPD